MPTGTSTLHLLRVVDVPVFNGSMRGQAQVDTLIIERERTEAQTYLNSVTKRLQGEALSKTQLSFTTSVIVNPDVPGTIIRQAEEEHCDLIALATHGRGALMRALMGSVTERVISHTTLPLLVTRPQEPVVECKEADGPISDEKEFPSWVGLF